MTARIAIPKPYMRPQLHTAPLWPQINASKGLSGIITIFVDDKRNKETSESPKLDQ